MANLPISGFPTGGTIAQAGDEFVIARSGANYKLTSSSISSFVLGGPTTQLGAADAAAPVPQFFKVQGVVAGTSNTAGANFTIQGSQGTGTGAGGSIIFQVAPAGSSGTAQNAYSTALTIASDGNCSFAGSLYGVSGVYKGASGTANNGISFNYSGGSDAVLWGTTGGKYARIGSGQLTVVSGASIGWSSNSTNAADNAADVSLFRDAANTLALRNGTNAQIFRAYSTTTGPNYGYFAAGVTDAGVATADTLFIGTGGAGAAMTKLQMLINGTNGWDYNISVPGSFAFYGAGGAAAKGIYLDNGFVGMARDATSSIRFVSFLNWNFTSSNSTPLLTFGGTTSSFPALKRSTTTLQVRLADDSGDAALQCGTQTAGGTAFNVNGTGGNSIASVTNTTTGTLLQVLNSTSNPLMTVTDTTSGTLFSVQSTTAATLFSVNDTTSGTLLAVTNSSATDVFTVSDAGVVNTASNVIIGTTGSGWKMVPTSSTALVFWDTSNSDSFAIGPYDQGIAVTSAGSIGWGSSTSPSLASRDVILARDNAAELALRNGNNGQIFRVYGRYTDGSNYERFFINAPTTAGTAVQIGTQKAGSGTARALELQTDGATRLTINANGTIDLLGSSQINTSGTYQAGGASGGAALATTGLFLASGEQVKWSSTSAWSGGIDAGLGRATVGVVSVTNGSTGAGALQFTEQTAPAAPAANGVRIYAEDNGSGKTRLMALFATGAAQQIAIEP